MRNNKAKRTAGRRTCRAPAPGMGAQPPRRAAEMLINHGSSLGDFIYGCLNALPVWASRTKLAARAATSLPATPGPGGPPPPSDPIRCFQISKFAVNASVAHHPSFTSSMGAGEFLTRTCEALPELRFFGICEGCGFGGSPLSPALKLAGPGLDICAVVSHVHLDGVDTNIWTGIQCLSIGNSNEIMIP